jgi:hypothetical protein
MAQDKGEQIPRDPISCDGSDSLLKETLTFRLSEKAKVCTGRPLMAGRVNRATLGTMCPSITLGSILSRDTAYTQEGSGKPRNKNLPHNQETFWFFEH